MLEVEVKDINNNVKRRIGLADFVFNNPASESLVHTAIVSYLANQRQGTHSTKTRGLVAGGGKKPWRQKKTGRARHGSIRSPIWRGGGIVFGPQPRDYSIVLPRKMKKIALYKALTMKLSDGEIIVVDSIKIERPNTKEMDRILKNLGLEGKKVLIVLPSKDESVMLSARNLPLAGVLTVSDLNPYHVASFDYIVLTEDSILKLQADARGVS